MRVAAMRMWWYPTVWRATERAGLVLLGVLVLLLVLGGPSGPGLSQDFQYKLGSGDQIKVTVFNHEDLSGEFEVGASGQVALPLIGDVTAKGLTLKQLEASIVDLLKPDYLKNPRVAVNVLNYRPFYIFGEVKAPGGYAYVAGMRVVEAVALAGGFTYRARENELLIQRADTPGGEKKPADQNTIVLPGDVIEVPQRFF